MEPHWEAKRKAVMVAGIEPATLGLISLRPIGYDH